MAVCFGESFFAYYSGVSGRVGGRVGCGGGGGLDVVWYEPYAGFGALGY